MPEEDEKHHTDAEINNMYNFGQDNVYTYALDAFSAHDIDRALIDNVRQELKKELKEVGFFLWIQCYIFKYAGLVKLNSIANM